MCKQRSVFFKRMTLVVLLVSFLPFTLFSEEGSGVNATEKLHEKLDALTNTTQELNKRVSDLENRLVTLSDSHADPEDSKVPVQANTGSIANGESLFMQYCSKCHGDSGTGDGPFSRALSNIPDLTTPEIQNQSDQALFSVITQGASPMPSFRSLPEQDRWDLVSFIKTLSKK